MAADLKQIYQCATAEEAERERRINWRSSSGIAGRPDWHGQRHGSRQPARCQRIKVSGAYHDQGAAPIEQLGLQG